MEIAKKTALKNDLDNVDNHNLNEKLMHPKNTTSSTTTVTTATATSNDKSMHP